MTLIGPTETSQNAPQLFQKKKKDEICLLEEHLLLSEKPSTELMLPQTLNSNI